MINQDRLITTFCDLVRIDSPSGEEEEVAQELTRRLSGFGFSIERDSYGNLIASEEGDEPLLISAHMDTVEPGRGIKPQVLDDRIVSDGTTILGGDCKAGVASILEALESLHEDGTERVPVQLVFTREEELGLVGARNLDISLVKAKRGVVFDGNGPPSKVTSASATNVIFTVNVTGRSAHAGVEPEKGLSAIRIAAEIITGLRQGRLDEETTINVGVISGGSVRNAVPEEASFIGEFRSRNIESLEMVRLEISDVLEQARGKYPDAVIEENMNVAYEMYRLSMDNPMIRKVSRILEGMGKVPDIVPSGGGTDGNVFNKHGIGCVVVGMSTQDMHTVREYVPIADLTDTARFCQALLLDKE